jgi:hypothetical protein
LQSGEIVGALFGQQPVTGLVPLAQGVDDEQVRLAITLVLECGLVDAACWATDAASRWSSARAEPVVS